MFDKKQICTNTICVRIHQCSRSLIHHPGSMGGHTMGWYSPDARTQECAYFIELTQEEVYAPLVKFRG